jgi:hypothetical protein
MREGAEYGRSSGVPCNGPISMRLDNFGWFPTANQEVKVSNGGSDFVIGEGGK